MNNIEIAQKIKLKCKENNITVSKLTSECNLSKSLIYDLEKRNYYLSSDRIFKIAKYLNCSIDYLLGNDKFEISHDEKNMLNNYKKLDDLGRQKVKNILCEEIKRVEEIEKYENMEIRYLARKPKDPNSLGEKPNFTAEEVLRLKKYLLKLDEGINNNENPEL